MAQSSLLYRRGICGSFSAIPRETERIRAVGNSRQKCMCEPPYQSSGENKAQTQTANQPPPPPDVELGKASTEATSPNKRLYITSIGTLWFLHPGQSPEVVNRP